MTFDNTQLLTYKKVGFYAKMMWPGIKAELEKLAEECGGVCINDDAGIDLLRNDKSRRRIVLYHDVVYSGYELYESYRLRKEIFVRSLDGVDRIVPNIREFILNGNVPVS